ncbi:MAG: LLM class flavin-dependent oxidoreductase [Sciscionella sp.]
MTESTAVGGPRPFRFGVVAPLTGDLPTWRDRVRRIADSGYSTLLMPDFPHWQPAPGPALAVAATVADLRVGTWVYASPLRPAWSIAWEAHSLSMLTEGRFEMGIGTGRPGIEDLIRELGMSVGLLVGEFVHEPMGWLLGGHGSSMTGCSSRRIHLIALCSARSTVTPWVTAQ